jgi:hypothetical protein
MPGDDEILRIAAQFDVSSITAGMDTAASAVQTGSQRIAASLKASGMSASETASALKNLGYSAEEAQAALGSSASEFEAASSAADRTTRSVNNSRIAFTGLTQDLGVRGSRALGSFIAQSATLGPILQAAFPIVAAVAFFEILDAGYTKLIEATSALVGWNKEAKAMYAQLVELNSQQVTFNERLDIERISLAEVGLKGAALDQQKLIDLKVEQKLVGDAYNASLLREKNIRAELTAQQLQNVVPIPSTIPGIGGLTPTAPGGLGEDKDRIAQLTKELDEAMRKTQSLHEELQTLATVTIPKTGLEQVAKDAEEAAKAAEKADKEAETEYEKVVRMRMQEEEELFERARKAAEEEERLQEELSRTTQELAKKDLEEFERSLVEKTRLQEEAGKNAIEMMKAQAEAQSKDVQARSFAGAADPALIKIADAALDEQAFKIMDLIALEEKLRDALRQTGIAETDPKIQESLAKQQQLVQQLAVAMQKYNMAVQDVADKGLKSFEKSFDQITNKLNSAVIGWMSHTETFGRAMMKVWDDLATTAITSLLKVGEQELVGLILHQTIADSEKLTSAETAAANTYASTSAIPIIGPVLAPAAAAVAFAAVMAFEKGGIMGNTEGLALLHPREMVLPSHISQSVQQMASGGPGTSSGGSGGHFHVEQHFHGNMSKSDMAKMEDQMTAVIKRARRRGSLG